MPSNDIKHRLSLEDFRSAVGRTLAYATMYVGDFECVENLKKFQSEKENINIFMKELELRIFNIANGYGTDADTAAEIINGWKNDDK